MGSVARPGRAASEIPCMNLRRLDIARRARAPAAARACAAALCAAGAANAQGPPAVPPIGCAPEQGHAFICGAERPEDLAPIPGSRWLIASGFSAGSGLKLVDTDALELRRWYTGEPAQRHPDAARFPACMGPPDASLLNVQGISLRGTGGRDYELYATNHGGREAIEVFGVAVPSGAGEPALQWRGCVPMPEGMAANSVTTLADGTMLATVLLVPGKQMADYVERRVTGRVYEWRPGWSAFRHVRGADLPGNNGIEFSADGREFYVVAFGWHSILRFSHSNPARLLGKAQAPGFMPDNIHREGDHFITAGMSYDEPACGGRRRVIDGKADLMGCHRGYVVARFAPRTLAWSVVAYAEPNPSFNGVSTGVVVGNRLWLGSWQADRLAMRELPGL
jgi:hypothetical protein